MMDLQQSFLTQKSFKFWLSLSFLCLFFFFFLSIGEYFSYKYFLLRSLPATTINIINPPPGSSASNPQISWRVASTPTNISSTSIYYDYQSTPSALLTTIPPQEVAYSFHTPDYSLGNFPIPATFIANLTSLRSGTVYYRAYANVGGEHFWTPEFSLLVP